MHDLGNYVKNFYKFGVDGKLLRNLTADEMEELGIKFKLLKRKLALEIKAQLDREKELSSPKSVSSLSPTSAPAAVVYSFNSKNLRILQKVFFKQFFLQRGPEQYESERKSAIFEPSQPAALITTVTSPEFGIPVTV